MMIEMGYWNEPRLGVRRGEEHWRYVSIFDECWNKFLNEKRGLTVRGWWENLDVM